MNLTYAHIMENIRNCVRHAFHTDVNLLVRISCWVIEQSFLVDAHSSSREGDVSRLKGCREEADVGSCQPSSVAPAGPHLVLDFHPGLKIYPSKKGTRFCHHLTTTSTWKDPSWPIESDHLGFRDFIKVV